MPARKRGRAELEAAEPPEPPSLLHQIRNRWEFANLAQYINLFGDAVRIDKDVDVEVSRNPLISRPTVLIHSARAFQRLIPRQELENEFLRTEPSQRLAQIGLCLLKFVSSHRGLTYVPLPSHMSDPD